MVHLSRRRSILVRTEPPRHFVDSIRAKIREDLNALGKLSPDEIAKRLYAEGIRGFARTPDDCPIKRRLQKLVEAPIMVFTSYIVLKATAANCGVKLTDVPDSVRHFILQFDAGRYPFLQEGAHRIEVFKSSYKKLGHAMDNFSFDISSLGMAISNEISQLSAPAVPVVPTVEFASMPSLVKPELVLAGSGA